MCIIFLHISMGFIFKPCGMSCPMDCYCKCVAVNAIIALFFHTYILTRIEPVMFLLTSAL